MEKTINFKALRNYYIKEYDRLNGAKSSYNRIVYSYKKQYEKLNEKRPLSLEDARIEIYLEREFATFKRKYDVGYENVIEKEAEITQRIMIINNKLGYDAEDLDSDDSDN